MTCSHIQRNNKLKKVNNHFCVWPRPWPNGLDTQTWPSYGQDISPYKNEVPMWSSTKVIVWTDRNTDRCTDRQTYRQTDRQTDGQTERQTDKQTDEHDWKHYLPAFAGGKYSDSRNIFIFLSPLITIYCNFCGVYRQTGCGTNTPQDSLTVLHLQTYLIA